jgi:hypothetical protein
MGEGAFTGTPRVLSCVNKLLAMMDWQVGGWRGGRRIGQGKV